MYALRDLTGHCYVHFAFVFTLSQGREEMAAFSFRLDSLKTATLIRNFRETATCVRSFHVDNKPVGFT